MFIKTAAQINAIELLTGLARYILLYGGSRSGKTAILIYAVICRALKAPGSRHAILRSVFAHIKSSICYDTFPKVMDLIAPDYRYRLNKQDWFARFHNGSEIWFGGLDDKERVEKILGNEYSTLYFNEISQIRYDPIQTALTRLAQKTELVNKAYFDCNPPSKNHWAYSLFIKNIDPKTKLPKQKDKYAFLRMNPKDNLPNLPPDYLDILNDLPLRERLRFLEGEFLDDIEGALWTYEMIESNRAELTFDEIMKICNKIVIGVDPQGSHKKSESKTGSHKKPETGIVVAGRISEKEYLVIDDLSLSAKPEEWAKMAVQAYRKYEANYIVAEKNYGGEMVRAVIKAVDPNVPVISVSALKGKILRAEPISVLYEENKVKHCKVFNLLEDQMTSFTGDPNDVSPDRLDAMVWAMTELSQQKHRQPGIW